MMTRVGPGTPAGELLRRYWYPVCVAKELDDKNPTKFVRLLGENLVLFRDKTGRWASSKSDVPTGGLPWCMEEWKREALPAPIMAGFTM